MVVYWHAVITYCTCAYGLTAIHCKTILLQNRKKYPNCIQFNVINSLKVQQVYLLKDNPFDTIPAGSKVNKKVLVKHFHEAFKIS